MTKQKPAAEKPLRPQTAFLVAVINGDWPAADEAYRRIPEVQLMQAMTDTVICLVEKNYLEQLRYMLKEFAAAQRAVAQVSRNRFPLGVAFHNGNFPAIELLMSYGANPLATRTIFDKKLGRELTHTILDFATWSYHRRAIELARHLMNGGTLGNVAHVATPQAPRRASANGKAAHA